MKGDLIATFNFGATATTPSVGTLINSITPTVESAFTSTYRGANGILNMPSCVGVNQIGWVIDGVVAGTIVSCSWLPSLPLLTGSALDSDSGRSYAGQGIGLFYAIGLNGSSDPIDTVRSINLRHTRAFRAQRDDQLRIFGAGRTLLANTEIKIYEWIALGFQIDGVDRSGVNTINFRTP